MSSVEKMTRAENGDWGTWEEIGDLPAKRWDMMLVYNGMFYILAGNSRTESGTNIFEDTILKSEDGVEWEEVMTKLSFPRRRHTAISTEDLCTDTATTTTTAAPTTTTSPTLDEVIFMSGGYGTLWSTELLDISGSATPASLDLPGDRRAVRTGSTR